MMIMIMKEQSSTSCELIVNINTFEYIWKMFQFINECA